MQVLIYPVTDANVDRPSYLDPENQLLLTRDSMIWFFDHYIRTLPGALNLMPHRFTRRISPVCHLQSCSPPSMTRCATKARSTPNGLRMPASRSTCSDTRVRCTHSSHY